MTVNPQSLSYEELLVPPPRRARGLKAEAWLAAVILTVSCMAVSSPFLAGPLQEILFGIPRGVYDRVASDLLGYAIFIIAGIVLLGGAFGFSPQFRTLPYTWRRYRKAWRAARGLRDQTKGEATNYFLPALNVEGRKLFVVSYRHRLDHKEVRPIATFLLDEHGRLIVDDALFEKAYTTYNFALWTTLKGQSTTDVWRRAGRKILNKHIPRARNVLEANRERFEEVGEKERLRQAIEGLDVLRSAVLEVDRFLSARMGYMRAAGYGQRPEYYYEEADRLERLGVAFGRKLEDEYGFALEEVSRLGKHLLFR
ncbi:MAG TPA: hypothetical protein VJ123_06940, partial [Anaerolineales bacterium]|nr:hypothetical protein [Anaerolineales bacterium]